MWQPTVKLSSVQLEVTERANDNSPIAVDFVAVRDPELVKTLQNLTAGQWFSSKSQILMDYSDNLKIWTLELVPGSQLEIRETPLSGESADGLLMFAGYSGEGAHRLRLDQARKLKLKFDDNEVRVLKKK
ncbi:MAG: type VI secretion protein [Betaproteobacteria bacterium]|nr:type VI secretion protein [Betaproteobacteria bacterium]